MVLAQAVKQLGIALCTLSNELFDWTLCRRITLGAVTNYENRLKRWHATRTKIKREQRLASWPTNFPPCLNKSTHSIS